MTKLYHINEDGVAPCGATHGKCPYAKGEQNNHFTDAGEAMAVFEHRLSKEHNPLGSVSKKTAAAPAKGAESKALVEAGADPKEIRDALRKENPTWNTRQVHTVQKQMTGVSVKSPPPAVPASPPTPTVSPKIVHELMKDYKLALFEKDLAQRALANVRADLAAREGRAFHYGPGGVKIEGANPNGSTFFSAKEYFVKERREAAERYNRALKEEENTQTAVEESGNGHQLPDDGNVIRVRTQAQKWLLKDELQGQISDGQWENSGPQDHWQVWSSAKVIVDPQNPGRNFNAKKDNYQLNSSSLLSIVGDRMVDNVQDKTGDTYDTKAMQADLKDLRNIFKEQRSSL